MRILFVGLALPYPPMNGHRLRTWAMLRALAEDGHEVTLASFADPDEITGDLRCLREICRTVELVPTPEPAGALAPFRRLLAVVSPLPYAVRRLRSPALTRAIENRLARGSFDAVICDGIYNAQNLPPRLLLPVMLNKDDVAHVILRRYVALEKNPARRLYGALEAAKVLRWERQACRRMAAVLTCSMVDRAILQALCPGTPMFVVPNVVDTDHYAPAGESEPNTVLFQGGMDWHPNRDAVTFFAAAILPELQRLLPGVTFRVAGRSPSDAFRRRFTDTPAVEFTGTVPDIRLEIARAAVCVVPLRIGSGTKLKILEAAAMAKPIVSTTLGAEGLDLVHDKEIVLADAPGEFAHAVATLLRDPPRRIKMGRHARVPVVKAHSYPVLRAALRTVVSTVTSRE